MKEFGAVITIDIPLALTAEDKADALQQAVATDKEHLMKRIKDMDFIQITVPYIKELQEEKKLKRGKLWRLIKNFKMCFRRLIKTIRRAYPP